MTGGCLLAGVIGWPVAHSLSPRLHGFWLGAYGIDGAYVPLAVKPEDLGAAVRALPKLGFQGANVTVPHKQAVMAHLDRVDPLARRIGAVNTLVVDDDGAIEGQNTDAFGFMENLKDSAPDWSAESAPAVVVGAGGAARAVIVGLLDAGAPAVRLVNRTRARAEELAATLDDPRIETVDWTARAGTLEGAGLVVNTTTLGMSGNPPLDLDLTGLAPEAVVTDIVYTPLETPLLKAAKAQGLKTVDGLGMLIHQARPGFAAWFGRAPEVTPDLRATLLQALGAKAE